MASYALIDSENNILRYENFEVKPKNPTGKGWKWLPFVEDPDPSINHNFQYFTITDKVNKTNVRKVKTVVNRNPEEVLPYVINNIKKEAQKLISSMFVNDINNYDIENVLIKQINFLARGTELVNKKANGEVITDAEQIEIDNYTQTWDMIKQIRDISNQKEAEIANMTTDELMAYDVTTDWV